MKCWQCKFSRARDKDGNENTLWKLQKRLVCVKRNVRSTHLHVYNPKALEDVCGAFEAKDEKIQKAFLKWMNEHGLPKEIMIQS